MKRTKMSRWNLSLCVLLTGCALPCSAQEKPLGEVHSAENRAVNISARRAVAALQNNDTAVLARLAHPKGLRFAPYVHFSKRDMILRRSTVAALRRSPRVYNWGDADGTGDAIRLPWNAFRLRYLTPKGKNFLAGEINFNTVKTRGNTINNLRETYPGAICVEFHLPGTPKYSGMDWRGLWLVWRPVGKNWYLCAVAGDAWTI